MLESLEDLLWVYFAPPLLFFTGIYLSYLFRLNQLRKFPRVLHNFWTLLRSKDTKSSEVHPIKAFFACIGGCIGIGNIIGVCTAVQIGGPGALFWVWMTAILGSIIKYSEVYLGVKFRVRNKISGTYEGGPLYFWPKITRATWIPKLIAIVLVVYGVEVYQFAIMANSVSENFGIAKWMVVVVFMGLTLFAGQGGVRRVGTICSAVIPLFVLVYLGMTGWILWVMRANLPGVIEDVFVSAFTGHAAVGGFAGSTVLMAMSQGIRRGCYSADLGVGYASMIHAESREKDPAKQAALTIFDVFLDSFIVCTTSVALILITGVWKEPMDASLLVQTALSQHFPLVNVFMPFFLMLLGYSTTIAYFIVGLKCARFLSPKWGGPAYYVYAGTVLTVFSMLESSQAYALMACAGALLLVLNTSALLLLRKEIAFEL